MFKAVTIKGVNIIPSIIAVVGLACVALTFVYAHDKGIYESIKNDPRTISASAHDGYYTIVDTNVCRMEKYILFGFDVKPKTAA